MSEVKYNKPIGATVLNWEGTGLPYHMEFTCENCGKLYEEDQSFGAHSCFYFNGKTYGLECCGILLDKLYEQFKEPFLHQACKEFLDNPNSYLTKGFIGVTLPLTLRTISERISARKGLIDALVNLLDAINAVNRPR